MSNKRRLFGVIPLDSELPTYSAAQDPADRLDLLRFWEATSRLHHHEDVLFNSRLQVFLITTSFLLAAFSQFKDAKFFPLQVGMALLGMAWSSIALVVLRRTATAIQWYLLVLRRLEVVLFSEDRRPYQTRRWLTSEASRNLPGDNTTRTTRPTSVLQGIWLPKLVISLWVFILLWSFYDRFGFPFCF
jgi:hypothetical protein